MNCEACGMEMKLVPAGISKRTGKSYKAFWGHSDKTDCTWKPPEETPKPQQAPEQGINTKELIKQQDNDKNKTMLSSYVKDIVVAYKDKTEEEYKEAIRRWAWGFDFVLPRFKHSKMEAIEDFSPFNE